jgi:alkanesulfonate monooxygenase SsuD/methylene tetrahydromethanopterin reductase-like flavin-dependent oxidoreductase (luciferase family)
VIEGLHGVPLDRPLSRMCETVEIVRQAASGEKVSHSGREFQIPLPGGDGKPMRLSMRAEYDIPVYLATLSPKMLHVTGEIADGWLGTGFVPESAKEAYFDHLDRGLANAGRTRADLDICQGAEVAFADDEDALRVMVADCNKELAFSLGGMGSATTNFYNNAYSRQGWAEVAAEVRERWQAGDRDGAAGVADRNRGHVVDRVCFCPLSTNDRRLDGWGQTNVGRCRGQVGALGREKKSYIEACHDGVGWACDEPNGGMSKPRSWRASWPRVMADIVSAMTRGSYLGRLALV